MGKENMVYMHMEFYLAMKNDIMLLTGKEVELENTLLQESKVTMLSQSHKDKYHMFSDTHGN